jgi:putative lipoprotein
MALSGIEQFIIFGFVPLVIGMLAGPARPAASFPTVAGKLVLPPCDPLPDTARVVIELIEGQRGESPMPALVVAALPWHGGGMQDFALALDRSDFDPLACYALRARIDAAILFKTAHPQPTAPLSGGRSTLLLMPVG